MIVQQAVHSKISHITVNLLLHYLVKSECAAVIQFKVIYLLKQSSTALSVMCVSVFSADFFRSLICCSRDTDTVTEISRCCV